MALQSNKKVVDKNFDSYNSIYGEFDSREVNGLLRDRGYVVIYEKAHLCPCKSKESTHRNVCKNCGGGGWIFVNPLRTRMIITSIMSDGKFSQAQWIDWGMVDSGSAMITSFNDEKMSFMDKITIENATTEKSEIVYPSMTDDATQLFAFTKYNIKSIDYIALFLSPEEPLKKLELETDYTFRDNVILLNAQYNDVVDPSITIRYVYHPVLHIVDVLRESITSTKGSATKVQTQMILPIKALGKKAHLVKEAENFKGDELIDNSWEPEECDLDVISDFVRQLRYSSASTIYNNLTAAQRIAIDELLQASD